MNVTATGASSSADDHRQQVVEKAAELFDRNGFHETSMAEIARAVGLRKPSLYYYVSSKDEILFWIHEEFINHMISRAQRRIGVPMSAEQRLLELMVDTLELMETRRSYVRVFFEHRQQLSGDRADEIQAKRDEWRHLVAAEITRGVGDGAFRPVDTRLATLALVGMCSWAYRWYDPRDGLRPREVAYIFWDFLLNGIKAAPSEDARPAVPRRRATSGPRLASRTVKG